MKNEYRCVVVGFMPIAAVMAASLVCAGAAAVIY